MNYSNSDIKLLIIDDVADNLQVIGSILMEQNYDVSFARSGEEALGILENNNFDLILLDILMPVMDGFEVCKKIRKKPEITNIPIVFLTARSDIDSVIKGFDLGAQDYISKPFKAEELLARVKTQVELKKQREQLEDMNSLLEKRVNERTRQLREANQQLAILEKAKNNFLTLISHELRTPLNILSGFSEILEESLKEKADVEALKHIRSSTEKLINLSETALLITEIQLGKYLFDFKPVDLVEITREALRRHASSINKKAIKTNTRLPEKLFIKGDHDLLLNSVVRIIENAVEVIDQSGNIYIDSTETDKEIEYIIGDDGPGFTADNLKKIFEVFSKNIDISSYSGFGLGLPAVKLVMDIHAGTIEARNRQQGGAQISLKFPKEN